MLFCCESLKKLIKLAESQLYAFLYRLIIKIMTDIVFLKQLQHFGHGIPYFESWGTHIVMKLY